MNDPRKKLLDKSDLIALIGLTLFIAGIGWRSRPIAAIVLGTLLMFYAYATAKPARKPPES